ncbi:reverse transcriptase domain-containing protein [Tanacetum coccineum]
MIGSTLTEEGRNKLCDLLQHNLDVFAWKPADMTGVPRHIAEHWLNIRERCPPVRQKRRSQTTDRNQAIQEEVEKLVDAGIMKEVNYHSWLSNPVMVKKHDDSWRMCVDFKDLSKACPKDGYLLPKIDWKMPFGLRNVGATYHRLVDKAFDKQIGRNIEVYADDLVIKIQKGMFVGYKVNTKGIKVCPDKVDVVLSLPSPKCLKDVQKLNGMLASLNRFLAKSTEKSLPFFKTLEKCTKKSDFHYTKEAEAVFKQMKQLIAELPTLTIPEEKEELIVNLAAAKEAVSAVLMTEREAKKMPIYFVSRALRGPKVNYTSMEKLVLALVHASKHGSSCADGSGAGVILTNPEGAEFTYSLRFRFEATNNEAEYEALIAGLRIAEEIGKIMYKVDLEDLTIEQYLRLTQENRTPKKIEDMTIAEYVEYEKKANENHISNTKSYLPTYFGKSTPTHDSILKFAHYFDPNQPGAESDYDSEELEEEVEYMSDKEVIMGEQEESNHGYTQNIPHFEEKDDVDEWLNAKITKHMSMQGVENMKDALISIIKSIIQEMKDGIMKRQSEASTGSISDEVSSIASNAMDKDDNNTSNTAPYRLPEKLSPGSFLLPFNIYNHSFYAITTLDAKDNIMPLKVRYGQQNIDDTTRERRFGHNNLHESNREFVFNEWILDSYNVEEEYAREIGDPYSRRFDEYNRVFNNEIGHLSNEYILRIGKKGFICITDREDEALPLGRVNGARSKAMVKKQLEGHKYVHEVT